MKAIVADGVMVAGARSERERVKHPMWSPLSQSQSTLIKLARSIPLVNPKPDTDGAQWDEFLQAVMADDEHGVSH